MVLRMESPELEPKVAKKRKRDSNPVSNSNNIKLGTDIQAKKSKIKKIKSAPPVLDSLENKNEPITKIEKLKEEKSESQIIDDALKEKYPVFKNEDLIQKFLAVPMTNNQKGRIRQVLRDSLKGTSDFLLPDVINNRIQGILKSPNLTETELRKIRILYNMLKTALLPPKPSDALTKKKKPNKKKDKGDINDIKEEIVHKEVKKEHKDVKIKKEKVKKEKDVKDNKDTKVKGPKRYVVFVGNLPPDIDKEKIMQHFAEFNECITNIRIPKRPDDKKSSIAYVECKNEPTYELALSKHHSMLGNKRINVLYTTQKNGKVSKTEAKSKSAKLIALQKAGKLIGSVPVNRKRSHRRMKMKRAQAKQAAETA